MTQFIDIKQFSHADKVILKQNSWFEVVSANQNILGKFLALSSLKYEETKYFRKALIYPMFWVFPDDTKRQAPGDTLG